MRCFNSKHVGFSLIELLVAMAILSMTILISSVGYSFFMQRWEDNLGSFEQQADMARKMKIVQSAITSIYPYILRKSSGEPGIYFEGTKDGFIAITNRSVYGTEAPAVMRLSVAQDNDFSYHLSYQEYPLTGAPMVSLTRELEFQNALTVLEGVGDIAIEYYGFRNITEMNNQGKRSWWQTFNSLQRGLMPDAIRVLFIWQGQQQVLEFTTNQVDTRQMSMFQDGI